MRSFYGIVRGDAEKAEADRMYAEVAGVLRGRELDQVFDVMINHLGGLIVANGIDLNRTIDALKTAEAAYRHRAPRSPIWTP